MKLTIGFVSLVAVSVAIAGNVGVFAGFANQYAAFVLPMLGF